MVRCWFELYWKEESYYDLLSNQLQALERFIRREKTISQNTSKAYLNFIIWIKKIVNSKGNKKALNALAVDISKKPNLGMREWLLSKTT